jgi:Cell wall-active antibiotics response 4TMS YvqF
MTQVSLPQHPPTQRAGSSLTRFVMIGSALVLAVAALGAAGAALRPGFDGSFERRSYTQAAEGAQIANIRLEFGAGNLSLGALDASDDALARMHFEGPAGLRPEALYDVRGGVGDLGYVSRHADQVWQNFPFIGRARDHADLRVQLAPSVPMTLDVQAGAADSLLDLTGLRVTRFDLQTGAADTRVRLPEAAGFTTVVVKAGIAQLQIEIPRGVAADIDVTTGLGERAIDQSRFAPLGNGRFRSPEYETAANRVQMRLELGIGEVSVR